MTSCRPSRRFRFGLRSLFVAMTLVCLLFAMLAQPLIEAGRERLFIEQAEKLGATPSLHGRVRYGFSLGRWWLSFFDEKYEVGYLYRASLSGPSISDQDLAIFDRNKYVSFLSLSGTEVTDAGMVHLSNCPNLNHLDLSNTLVTDAGVLRLRNLARLTSLDIQGTTISLAALAELDDQLPFSHFAEQQAIELIRAAGGQVISSRYQATYPDDDPVLPGNTSAGEMAQEVILGLNREFIFTRSQLTLVGYLDSINSLEMRGISIEPGSLADVDTLPKLSNFEIYDTDIVDVDLQHLSRVTYLKSLVLHNNKRITDAGIANLSKINSLGSLVVTACVGVTSAAIDSLKLQLPTCKIEYSTW